MCNDANTRANFINELHDKVKNEIKRKVENYVSNANKRRKEVMVQPKDWIWVHLRRDKFPNQRKSKLQKPFSTPEENKQQCKPIRYT